MQSAGSSALIHYSMMFLLSLLLSTGMLVLSSPVSPSSQYQVIHSSSGSDFFNNFIFFTDPDPTHGFVKYVDQNTAKQGGLIGITPRGSVYIGVDYNTTLSDSDVGRNSVRIESSVAFTGGLLVADIQHMPNGACGLWPAFWTSGVNWSQDGEIDIIEGVNLEKNEVVLHTPGQCQINGQGQTGTMTSPNCSMSGPTGCVVTDTTDSYGAGFNDAQGGVYALLWTDEFIRLWFFARDSIPTSITNSNPDPSSFGTPMANFQPASCSLGEEIKNQRIIFDTTFCGDWAGGVFASSGCPMSDSSNSMKSCIQYVATNPSQYQQAYWEINSIKIYQPTCGDAPGASPSVTPRVAST